MCRGVAITVGRPRRPCVCHTCLYDHVSAHNRGWVVVAVTVAAVAVLGAVTVARFHIWGGDRRAGALRDRAAAARGKLENRCR